MLVAASPGAIRFNGREHGSPVTSKRPLSSALDIQRQHLELLMAFIDYEEGRMTESLWNAQHQTLNYWFRQPGMMKFLDDYGASLYPPFVAYIKEQVITLYRDGNT